MIGSALPAVLLGILLCVGYASLLHLWRGRTLRDFVLYLLAAAVGFILGQLLGLLIRFPLLQVGQLHVVEASVVAWLALFSVREFTIDRDSGTTEQT